MTETIKDCIIRIKKIDDLRSNHSEDVAIFISQAFEFLDPYTVSECLALDPSGNLMTEIQDFKETMILTEQDLVEDEDFEYVDVEDDTKDPLSHDEIVSMMVMGFLYGMRDLFVEKIIEELKNETSGN